jgi:hypothetical protein
MDAPSLSELVPLLAEPLGIAALGAMAIWAGVRVVSVVIQALRDVELARVQVQQAMANAVLAQAHAAGEHAVSDRALREQVGALEIVIQRVLQVLDRRGST